MTYKIVVPPALRKRKGAKKPKISSMNTQQQPNPYPVGQQLNVYVDNDMKYLPCMPKPGASGAAIVTRIPNGSIVNYNGYVETTIGTKVLSVIYNDIEVYVGLGATKYLLPLRHRERLGRRYF